MITNGAQAAQQQRAVVVLQGLSKRYDEGSQQRQIFDRVDLEIYEGEFFALIGKSGSGKSTLLNLISGVDHPDAGRIMIGGTDVTNLNEREQTLFRREHIGIVFQAYNLIPTLTVLENITLPHELRTRRGARRDGEKRARALLERVGLGARADAFPDKLSGGEQQRVAIARALINEPMLVLADEPTGNLDESSGETVLQLLLELTREAGKTLVMATHNLDVIPLANRVCRLHEGKLVISYQQLAEQPVN